MSDSSGSETDLPHFSLSGSHVRALKQAGSKQYEKIVLSDSDSDAVTEVSMHKTAKRPCYNPPSVTSRRSDHTDSDSDEPHARQLTSPSSIVMVSSNSSSQSRSTQESGTVLDATEMLSDKELRREMKRRQAEEKLAQKMEREKQRAEKRQQKEMDRAVKKAAAEASKEGRPGERVKQMVVILDTVLSENVQFMAELAGELQALGVVYRISHDMHPGSVCWKRSVSERSVNDEAQILHNVTEKDESEMLVMLEAQGFLGLVHYTKQALLATPLPPGAQTLQQFVERLQHNFPAAKLTLAVEGVDAFLRGSKTRINRQFRKAVLATDPTSGAHDSNTASSSRLFSDVTRVDYEEALVELQLVLGCGVRMCANGAQLAQYVVSITRALAEVPYQRSNPFSFHSEPGSGASKKILQEAENKMAMIWKHQLMQLNNMSDHMATAVVAIYPSPAHLLAEYEACADSKSAELLLQNIMVRRGVGTVTSTRRLGPVQSKRIYTLMTSRDPNLTLV